MNTARILIVAGSDSSGGAGIQADIKTVTMLGAHAMTAVTAITAQNTLGVQAVHAVPAEIVVAQLRSCIADIGVDAVKIGMIGSAETAHAVADVLEDLRAATTTATPGLSGHPPSPESDRSGRQQAPPHTPAGRERSAEHDDQAPHVVGGTDGLSDARAALPIVFDPVMVATSGAVLADPATIAAFARLMRLATVVTPNLPELDALGGEAAVLGHGAALLVKGGHAAGAEITDRLLGPAGELARWTAPRIATRHTHGTGCTLASAIAAGLGQGLPLPAAIARARLFVRIALHEAPRLGGGHGPLGQQHVRLDVDLGAATPNQITLSATDHAASLAFYRALGLVPIVDSGGRYARFESAGGTTLSIETADEVAGKPIVFLEVADLNAAVAAARAAGIVVADPVAQSWGWREARVTDPAGNALRLYTAGEHRRFPPWRIACPD